MFVGLTDLKEGRHIESEDESVEEEQLGGVGQQPVANEALDFEAQPQGEFSDF